MGKTGELQVQICTDIANFLGRCWFDENDFSCDGRACSECRTRFDKDEEYKAACVVADWANYSPLQLMNEIFNLTDPDLGLPYAVLVDEFFVADKHAAQKVYNDWNDDGIIGEWMATMKYRTKDDVVQAYLDQHLPF